MQSTYQSEGLKQFSQPDSSGDWRFLLPMTEGSRVLIIGGEHEDFPNTFRKVGATVVTWLPAGDKNSNKLNGQAEADMVSNLVAQAFPSKSFDIVAIPFGFPSGNALNEADVFQLIHGLIAPGGTFLMGFSNMLGLKRNFQLNFGRSTPRRAISSLHLAGFTQVEVFGAISNLYTPEYIFPLNPQVLGFVLQHRYRYKMSAGLLYLLSNKLTVSVFLNFLSFYFITAMVM